MTICEMGGGATGTSYGSYQAILTEHLGMWCVSATTADTGAERKYLLCGS
jgi:hypothetical protein